MKIIFLLHSGEWGCNILPSPQVPCNYLSTIGSSTFSEESSHSLRVHSSRRKEIQNLEGYSILKKKKIQLREKQTEIYFSMEYKFKVRCFRAVGEPVEQRFFRSSKDLSCVIIVAIIKNIGNSRNLVLISMLMPQNLIFAKAAALLFCLPHFLALLYQLQNHKKDWVGTKQLPWVIIFLKRCE